MQTLTLSGIGTIQIGPVGLSVTDLDAVSEAIVQRGMRGEPGGVHLVNSYTLSLADTTVDYADCLQSGWLRLPDGRPLQWLSNARGDQPALSQVRGRDLVDGVIEAGLESGAQHFLLGSTLEVVELMKSRLEAVHPGVLIVGAESPPFRELTDAEREAYAGRIRDSGANIVWLGLGTPKQDFEAELLASQTRTAVIAVGAAFEFIAGTTREAPVWMTRYGFEWLFRLGTEPRRLWRRYLVGNSRFLMIAAKSLASSRRDGL